MSRKTKLMREIEQRYNDQPLETLLPQLYNRLGLPGMSQELGLSKGTLWYWLLRFGVSVQKVALAPGERMEIRRVQT